MAITQLANSKKWPPKKAYWLRFEMIVDFRQTYREYRQGHYRGARGDIFEVGAKRSRKVAKISSNDCDDPIREISIFGDTDDPEAIKNLRELEKYRIAYRRFRSGAAKGAAGELTLISQRLTRDHLRLLPVVELSRCIADQVNKLLEPATSSFHVHIGAGKLSLGLVVPAMNDSGQAFAILQRPSESWKEIISKGSQTVQVYVNEDFLTDLSVVSSRDDLLKHGSFKLKDDDSEYFEPHDSNTKLLVLDSALENVIIRGAKSYSCGLGPALDSLVEMFESALAPTPGEYSIALYACENDHTAVAKIREKLQNRLIVKECMVDRICSDRIIQSDKIIVKTEPYCGEIVVTARHAGSILPAFGRTNVRLPKTSGAYSYLYNRKYLLVNGTHTTLAFMTLRVVCTDPSGAPGDYPLLNVDRLDPTEAFELKAWTVARCLVLLHNTEVEVMKFAHGVSDSNALVTQLWDYAQLTIQRFNTIDDSTKRVLGGGVSNRYNTRLKHVLDTIETFDRSVPLTSILLRHTGISSIEMLKKTLRILIENSQKFVNEGQYEKVRLTCK